MRVVVAALFVVALAQWSNAFYDNFTITLEPLQVVLTSVDQKVNFNITLSVENWNCTFSMSLRLPFELISSELTSLFIFVSANAQLNFTPDYMQWSSVNFPTNNTNWCNETVSIWSSYVETTVDIEQLAHSKATTSVPLPSGILFISTPQSTYQLSTLSILLFYHRDTDQLTSPFSGTGHMLQNG